MPPTDKSEGQALLPPEPILSDIEVIETRQQRNKRWAMLGFAYLFEFLLICQFTIYHSVLWPYLRELDPGVKESFFGWVLGATALASTVSSPVLGYVANRFHQTRAPMLFGLSCTIAGNLGTMFSGSFPQPKWALLGFRIFTGFGHGSIAVAFGYIAMASTIQERNIAVTLRSAVASGSFLLGPGLASALSAIDGGVTYGPLAINMYTAPAIFGICAAVPLAIFLILFFEERWISVHASQMKKIPDESSEQTFLANYDIAAIIVCLYVRFTLRFTTAYDQSIGSPFTMLMFQWTAQEAIRYNGIIQSATGALDFVGNMVVGGLVLRYVHYRYLIPFGVLSFMLSFVVSFSYPGLPPLLDNSTFALDSNSTTLTCAYDWCSYTTRVYLWQYIASYAFVFAAFCISYAPVNILYSKLFGPRKQGVFQGISMMSSNLASALAPILVTTLFEAYGPRVAWTLGFCLNLSALSLCLLFFSRLITYDERIMKVKRGM